MDVNVPDRTRPAPAEPLLRFFLAGLGGVVVLVGAGLLVRDRTPAVDEWGLDLLRQRPDSLAHALVSAASEGFVLVSVAAATILVVLLLWYGRWRAVLPAIGYIALFLLLVPSSEALKPLFDRSHPSEPAESSFPSTHVVMVTAATLIAAGILWRLAPRWRVGTAVLGGILVVATAATRVLLGEHYVTDVVATGLGYTGVGLLCVRLLPVPRSAGMQPSIDA